MGFSQTLIVSNQRTAAAAAPPLHALLPAAGTLGCQGIPATVPLAARRLPALFRYQTLAPQGLLVQLEANATSLTVIAPDWLPASLSSQ